MHKYLFIIILIAVKLWCFFLPLQSGLTWGVEERILYYGKEHIIWYIDLLFSTLLVGQAMLRNSIGSGVRIVNPLLAFIFAFMWAFGYGMSTIGGEFVRSAEPALYLLLASFIGSVLLAFYLSFEDREARGKFIFSREKIILSVLLVLIMLSGALPVQQGIPDDKPDMVVIYGYHHANYYIYLLPVVILYAVVLFRQYLLWTRYLIVYFSVFALLILLLIGYNNDVFRFSSNVTMLSGGYIQLIASVALVIYAHFIVFNAGRKLNSSL